MIKPHRRERALESRQSVYWPKDKPPSILDGLLKNFHCREGEPTGRTGLVYKFPAEVEALNFSQELFFCGLLSEGSNDRPRIYGTGANRGSIDSVKRVSVQKKSVRWYTYSRHRIREIWAAKPRKSPSLRNAQENSLQRTG
jgi:hypothetical protein